MKRGFVLQRRPSATRFGVTGLSGRIGIAGNGRRKPPSPGAPAADPSAAPADPIGGGGRSGGAGSSGSFTQVVEPTLAGPDVAKQKREEAIAKAKEMAKAF